jgi:hypothetical protein
MAHVEWDKTLSHKVSLDAFLFKATKTILAMKLRTSNANK